MCWQKFFACIQTESEFALAFCKALSALRLYKTVDKLGTFSRHKNIKNLNKIGLNQTFMSQKNETLVQLACNREANRTRVVLENITPPDGGDALDFLLLLSGFLGFLLSHFSLLARVDTKCCVSEHEESTTFWFSLTKSRTNSFYRQLRCMDATIFAATRIKFAFCHVIACKKTKSRARNHSDHDDYWILFEIASFHLHTSQPFLRKRPTRMRFKIFLQRKRVKFIWNSNIAN